MDHKVVDTQKFCSDTRGHALVQGAVVPRRVRILHLLTPAAERVRRQVLVVPVHSVRQVRVDVVKPDKNRGQQLQPSGPDRERDQRRFMQRAKLYFASCFLIIFICSVYIAFIACLGGGRLVLVPAAAEQIIYQLKGRRRELLVYRLFAALSLSHYQLHLRKQKYQLVSRWHRYQL